MGVGIANRVTELLEDGDEPAEFAGGALALRQEVPQRVPLDELHGQEGPAVGQGAEVVYGRDAGVLQLAGDLRLDDEAGGGGGVHGRAGPEELDRDLAAE